MSTTALLRRAASSAASFTTLASSAPARPGVPRAMRSRFTLAPSGILRVCTRKICSRPFHVRHVDHDLAVEAPRPQERRVEDVGPVSGREEDDPSFDSKPSISTSSWLSVCSRSSCRRPVRPPRCRPDGVDLVDER